MQKVINVHIGEIKIAKNGELLKAILGSCVGIGMIWEKNKICGLAHCLLPEKPTSTLSIGGRFVDQAMQSLLSMMKIRPEYHPEVEVVIVGGGNMTNPGIMDNSNLVGTHNFKIAMKEAKKHGLRVIHSDGGGEEGRKILVDASNYTFKIEIIPRIIKLKAG